MVILHGHTYRYVHRHGDERQEVRGPDTEAQDRVVRSSYHEDYCRRCQYGGSHQHELIQNVEATDVVVDFDGVAPRRE